MALSELDTSALYELERKTGIVRDRIRDVAVRRRTSVCLFGPSGTGKTRLVRGTLDNMDVPYHELTGHTTPMGVFDAMKQHPDGDLFLDDNQNLLADRSGQEMLLAAADGGTEGVRVIRYTCRNKSETVRFSGGLYIVCNKPLHDDNEVMIAIKSRLRPISWDPTEAELLALMREATQGGWKHGSDCLTMEECAEAIEFLIRNCRTYSARLDLRLLFEVLLPDRSASKRGEHEADWRDHAVCVLREQVRGLTYSGEPKTREEQKQLDRQTAARIRAQHNSRPEQVAAWMAATAKSERAFDRRSAELRMAE